ncbi:pyruvate kinase, partial [uncultured Eubacterium sp.]
MKKTKIICTVGPATDDENILRIMIEKGMNVARFNFSHGEYDTHEARFNEVVKIRNELQMPVATLLDTKGPEIRLGDFEDKNGVEIKDGEDFILTTKKCKGTAKKSYVNYDGLPKDVHPGTTILINDGIISLKVNKVIDKDIYCTVVDGGLLTDRKGVNVPDVNLNMPYLSKKDMDDLSFGKKMDFDFIAASFCRSATDITIMRNYLEAIGWKTPKIIAKIENRQGLDNIDEIIEVADGIMVARGDLGVEVPFEE